MRSKAHIAVATGLAVALVLAAAGAMRLAAPRSGLTPLSPVAEPKANCAYGDLLSVNGVIVSEVACAGTSELRLEARSASSPRFLHRSPGHWVLQAGSVFLRSDDDGQHLARFHPPAGVTVDPENPMHLVAVSERNPTSHERVRELVHAGVLSPAKLIAGWQHPEAGRRLVTTWDSDDGGDSWSRR